MKKILYISNIKVPYRVRFFDGLAKHCDLTVLYERKQSSNRDRNWANSEDVTFRTEYMGGLNVKNEYTFSLRIFKHIFSRYDSIIIGCYNSPIQMLAMLVMRLFRIPFLINLDGEPFIDGAGMKTKLKRFFLKGASGYLVAGERAAKSVEKIADKSIIYPYHFSSLTEQEIESNRSHSTIRSDSILVVGQYFDYKGMDIAADVARKDTTHQYKFIGMGSRAELFRKEQNLVSLEHVHIIPFLSKEDLEREYKNCAMLVLPSRQECWGLVINEAASFGTPIISTTGSGAAAEFIGEMYPQFLAKPCDSSSLFGAITALSNFSGKDEYSRYLADKASAYTIEENINVHLIALGIKENCP